MQGQLKLIGKIARDVGKGERGDVAQLLRRVRRLQGLHDDLVLGDAATTVASQRAVRKPLRDALRQELEDLRHRYWAGHNETIVQGKEEADLDQRRVGGLVRYAATGRDDSREARGDSCGGG